MSVMRHSNRDLVRRREQFAEERERLSRRIEKLDTAIAGIDAALELVSDNFGFAVQVLASSTLDNVDNKTLKSSLKSFILGTARTFEGQFTAPALYEKLREAVPHRSINPTTVSHALRRAAEDGDLLIVEKGSGKRATVYRFAKQIKAETAERSETPTSFVRGSASEWEEEENGAETSEEETTP